MTTEETKGAGHVDLFPRHVTPSLLGDVRKQYGQLGRERDTIVGVLIDKLRDLLAEDEEAVEKLDRLGTRFGELETARLTLWCGLVDALGDHLALIERLAAELRKKPVEVSRLLSIELHARRYLEAVRDELGVDWAFRALQRSLEEAAL